MSRTESVETTTTATIVRFGSERSNHLTIIPRHAYPETARPGDREYLDAQVSLAAGDFRAAFQSWFSRAELVALREGLGRLYDQLRGEVGFTAEEAQVRLRFEGDGRGHIVLTGTALDWSGSSNRLDFQFTFDQTELHEANQALDSLLQQGGDRWADLWRRGGPLRRGGGLSVPDGAMGPTPEFSAGSFKFTATGSDQ